MSNETQGKMGVMSIALFTLCAVLVVDTLTASASIGVSSIGWWVVMLIFFVIPYGLITSELSTTYPGDGGIYDWNDDEPGKGKAVWPPLLEKYYQTGANFDEQDAKDRLLFRPIIESLQCLDEGVLRSVADGNIGSALGIGAPQWTGGYIQFVNSYGLQRFINRCSELAEKYGERFNAPEIVQRKLSANETFV